METRAHHVFVGLFAVLAVAGALVFALWLGRPASERDFDYYIVAFNRPVSGLSVGSRVEYSGIRVGEVTDLMLHPEDPRRVRALIRVYDDTPVNEETKANLALANISGAMKIQMFGGTPQSARLSGDVNNPPVIVAEPSSIGAVLESSEGVITEVSELLVRGNELLSEDNIKRVSQTLNHLEQTTRVFSENRDQISDALRDFAHLTAEANSALAELRQLTRETNASLNDEQRGLLSRAGESVATLERASQRVDRLLERNDGALDAGLQGLGELGPAVEELRSVLDNLDRITRRLEENPSGFLFRGEEVQEFEP